MYHNPYRNNMDIRQWDPESFEPNKKFYGLDEITQDNMRTGELKISILACFFMRFKKEEKGDTIEIWH
jgi:hypothetical protein